MNIKLIKFENLFVLQIGEFSYLTTKLSDIGDLQEKFNLTIDYGKVSNYE
jgi:hypothetical protein